MYLWVNKSDTLFKRNLCKKNLNCSTKRGSCALVTSFQNVISTLLHILITYPVLFCSINLLETVLLLISLIFDGILQMFYGLLNCYYCWLVCLQAPERAEVRLSIDNVMTGVLPYCWKQSWGWKVFSKRMREGMACSRRLSRSISESEEGLSEEKHGAVVLSCA